MINLLFAIPVAICSFLLVGFVRSWAIKHQILDVPNQRSSHSTSTPRGGGLAIVVTFLASVIVCVSIRIINLQIALALCIGTFIAIIGYIDDVRHVSPIYRIVVHFAVAATGLALLGGMPSLQIGTAIWHWGLVGHIIGVCGIVWMINLYNFMDGIDGLASSEAIFASLIASFLMLNSGVNGLAVCLAFLAAACLGFLLWNWPSARIFMGDVGSGFLGYVLAILAIASANTGFNIWIWVILLSIFIVDATLTFIRRVLRGEKWYEAHRSHAYQHAATRFNSHQKVVIAIITINVLWLTPLAIFIYTYPAYSLPTMLVAIFPVVAISLMFKAGYT